MAIRILERNTLSFGDDSKLEIPPLWVTALRDKLSNETLTFERFLSDFDNWIEERWATRTASDEFSSVLGVTPWDQSTGLRGGEAYGSMAELAENELYYYLRGYILGLALYEMSGGKRGATIITDKGIVEYPPKKKRHHYSQKRK